LYGTGEPRLVRVRLPKRDYRAVNFVDCSILPSYYNEQAGCVVLPVTPRPLDAMMIAIE